MEGLLVTIPAIADMAGSLREKWHDYHVLADSIIPVCTTAAMATDKALPDLSGKLCALF